MSKWRLWLSNLREYEENRSFIFTEALKMVYIRNGNDRALANLNSDGILLIFI